MIVEGVLHQYVNIENSDGFPAEIVDQKIEADMYRLINSRFYVEFDRVRFATEFGGRINTLWRYGSSIVRCRGLAWCARVLAGSDNVELAEVYCNSASVLADCEELRIA